MIRCAPRNPSQWRTAWFATRSSHLPVHRWIRQTATATVSKSPNQDGNDEKDFTSGKEIRFTTESYPEIKRNPRYARITKEHIDFFKSVLKSDNAILDGTDPANSEDVEAYNSDWMRKYRGQSKIVVKPANPEQVASILKYCNDNLLAVVPQGGNTGLVGGSVPVFDEIVINLARMNKIRSFDGVSGILVADAGVILEAADNFLAEQNHIFPLDLGAKGSCQIGGNVATNAGGLRLLRYGSLHGNVLGLEVVLADGTIVDDLSTLRKNNTGYDLKQLFIGAEGTIGIITAVSILCPQRSQAVNVAYFGLENYEKVQQAFKEAKGHLSEILSAFEMMDARSQRLYRKAKNSNLPIDGDYPFYCLIETSGSNSDHDNEKLQNFLEHVMETSVVADGVVAQDQTQMTSLWACREGVPEAAQHWGGVYKYDLSLPIADMYQIVDDTRKMLYDKGLVGDTDDFPVVDVVGYGHMGDSNLHLNVAVRWYDKNVEKALEPWVYEWVKQKCGSISAEHGLGLAKMPYVGYSKSDTLMRLMKQIKDIYDPRGILNPYKFLPP